jgi:methyltransferase-like protein 23
VTRDDPGGEPAWRLRACVIADRTWRLREVADQTALLALAGDDAAFPFGLMLWESALALSQWIISQPDILDGVAVLELGAGVGLAGMVAASRGARVTQTDHDPRALTLARDNAALNGVGPLDVRLGDWNAWDLPDRFALILGADIVYDAADHGAILDVVARALAPGGRVVLADPGRARQAAFIEAAERAGWQVDASPVRVADLRSSTPGAMQSVTILVLVRALPF